MLTMQQALTADSFHENHEPAGKIYTWRRNGQTQTWRKSPDHFRIPVKYGIRSYGQITQYTATDYHAAEDCPTQHVSVTEANGSQWQGIVIDEPIADRAGYGVTRVHVTWRGTSRHRVGSVASIATKYVTYL